MRGKTGVGYCKSTANAVHPFERLKARRVSQWNAAHPDDPISEPPGEMKVFPHFDRDTFNRILKEEGLKHDRDGKVRTAYSLRHTYISMRLMNGADVYQVANNCRTSVQMIEEHYASHIKNRLDASAINSPRVTPARKAKSKGRSAARRTKKAQA